MSTVRHPVNHAVSPPDRGGAFRETPCAHLRGVVPITVARQRTSTSRIAPDRAPPRRTVYHAASPPDRVGAFRETPCAHLRGVVPITVARHRRIDNPHRTGSPRRHPHETTHRTTKAPRETPCDDTRDIVPITAARKRPSLSRVAPDHHAVINMYPHTGPPRRPAKRPAPTRGTSSQSPPPENAHRRPALHRIATPSSTRNHTPNHQGAPRNAPRPSTGRHPDHRRQTPPIVVPHRTGSPRRHPHVSTHRTTKAPRETPRDDPRDIVPIAGADTARRRPASHRTARRSPPRSPRTRMQTVQHPVNHAASTPDRVGAFRETPCP